MELKNLPIGTSTFVDILSKGYVYVDKTEYLYKLISQEKGRYFLSRPRRFGKSLTCSTLATIFDGDKKLFNGLWIETSNYAWKKAPIIHLDFSQISYGTVEDLNESLHETLDSIADSYKVKVSSKFLKTKLKNLIITLNEKFGSVAVIIDEYDKALLDHIDEPDIAKDIQKTLRELYGAFKGKDLDAHLRFLFVTGVSKFSKVSLFSDVNNLQDITLSTAFDAIVGYTQEEVEANLHDHIQALADHRKKSYAETFEELKRWYNGFRFSPTTTTRVYNPVSLHLCLTEQVFSNYWFKTGTPNFLMKIFKKEPNVVKDFVVKNSWEISASGMDTFAPEVYYKKIIPLLLQTGYLTIKDYIKDEMNYILDYPNFECRRSMTEQIMEYVALLPDVTLGKFIARFMRALKADNIDEYCSSFRDYLKLIPHNIVVDREKFFQATFLGTALLIDVNVVASEIATDRGFVDIVLHGATKTFVMEFKKDKSPDVAMQQILEKKYYEKYLIEGKAVTLVGINFDLEEEGVNVAWIIDERFL